MGGSERLELSNPRTGPPVCPLQVGPGLQGPSVVLVTGGLHKVMARGSGWGGDRRVAQLDAGSQKEMEHRLYAWL